MIFFKFQKQFLFDENTIEFIKDHIKTFKYDSVLCIGTPR